MAWTATVIDSVQTGNAVETSVVLSDGVSIKFVQRYVHDGSQASLEALVQQTIAANSNTSKITPVAKGTALNTAAPTPTAPPAPDLALVSFVAKYTKHLKYQAGVTLGVYLASDPVVTQAQSDARAAYDSKTQSYFDALLT